MACEERKQRGRKGNGCVGINYSAAPIQHPVNSLKELQLP